MLKLSMQALRQLIAEGETTTVELKVAAPRPTELAERLCGMANGQGGTIIVGVEDASLQIVGVPDARLAMTCDMILRAARQIEPDLLLDPPDPEVYTLDERFLVVATVPPNRGPIYQASGVFWVRRGTYTVPLKASEILEVANDRGLQDWELQAARHATLEDLDLKKVEDYLSQRTTRSRHASRFDQIERVLIGMECALVTRDGQIVPTNAGIMFFGYDPQQHVMQSEVVCVLYRDELGIGGYVDRKIIRGTLPELVDATAAFLNKYVAVAGRIEGWKRVDLPEYPLEALREAVVNAVVHRDYSRRGESIRVFYYADRIEIHSPGLLLPGISVEQMRLGDVPSKLRNPVLANLLRDIPGYMERIGSGIRLMLDETRQMGLPSPQFREQSEFVVTFRRAVEGQKPRPAKAIPQSLPTLWGEEAVQPVAEEDRVEHRLAQAMQYVQVHGQITNREYRELTNISEATALRDLELLVERGALKKMGKQRGRHYRLP